MMHLFEVLSAVRQPDKQQKTGVLVTSDSLTGPKKYQIKLTLNCIC